MKRLIGGTEGRNNIAPVEYPWAIRAYDDMQNNAWVPGEINMGTDRKQYHHDLPPNLRHTYMTVFSTLTTSDVLILRNTVTTIAALITAPEVENVLAIHGFQEANHNRTYQLMVENLGLDENEVYTLYETVPAIRQKFELAAHYTGLLGSDRLADVLKGLVFYYLGFEGVFFYNGFPPIFAMSRSHNVMLASTDQLAYIARDECVSGDTEVFTQKGWIRFDELQDSDLVGQVDEAYKMTLAMPRRVVRRPHEGVMYEISDSHGLDMLLTPNHRVVYTVTGKSGFEECLAKDFKAGDGKSIFVVYDSRGDGNDLRRAYASFDLTVEEVIYSGMVYCVEVPTGMFLARRNGIAFVTGNCRHANYGIDLISGIMQENGLRLAQGEVAAVMKDVVDAERIYANYAVQQWSGYNAGTHVGHAEHMADHWVKKLGYAPVFGTPNQLPWLSEIIELKKEKAFFERRPTEYRVGATLDFGDSTGSVDAESLWR